MSQGGVSPGNQPHLFARDLTLCKGSDDSHMANHERRICFLRNSNVLNQRNIFLMVEHQQLEKGQVGRENVFFISILFYFTQSQNISCAIFMNRVV